MSTLVKILIYLFILNSFAQSVIVSEAIDLKNDSIALPGTLTYNKDLQQQPLVIFIHGSGNIDRNGNQVGGIHADYIKQLADSLNTRNIAFYRYDKRSSNRANAKFLMKGTTTIDSFVSDANIAVNHFKEDTRFSSITIIGHSQGSTIGMIVAQQMDVDKYVSLAGLGRTFENFVVDEYNKASQELGEIAKKHFKELNAIGMIRNVHPQLAHIFPKQNIPFLQSWMKYDPSKEIQKLTIPILLINGTKDVQVFPLDAQKLHDANPKSKLVIIENMNHVLKTVKTDEENRKSYASPDFALSDELINSLTTFIKN